MKAFAMLMLVTLASASSFAGGLVETEQSCKGNGLIFIEMGSEDIYSISSEKSDDGGYFAVSSELADETSEAVFKITERKDLTQDRSDDKCFEYVNSTSQQTVQFTGMSNEISKALGIKNGDAIQMNCEFNAKIVKSLDCE